MPTPAAVFTIVSANYIAFAATLMQSVRRFHPDIARFIILSDARHEFEDLDLAAEIIACDDLGIKLLDNMKLWYSVIEFNTAVKPFTFRHLFSERGFGSAVYLDPDIQLYAPLQEVFCGLQDHSLVLTPHMTKPLQDGKHPTDLSIMKSGIYNLGFAAIMNDDDGRALVDWWCARLFAHCRVDIKGNLFTDQRWMDLAPAFVPRTFLLRHPGYNIAYWNLVHRTVTRDKNGAWQVNGRALVFFHFSGIKPEDPTLFSKHQDRFTIETIGIVAELCTEYRARVLANGWLTHSKIPYAFATFPDGRQISDHMRNWVMRAIDDGRLPLTKPLRLGSFYFDAADDVAFAGGGRLTRFAHQFWLDRPDLQAAFNLNRQDGFDGYVAWFCDGSAEREHVPNDLVEAARRLRSGEADGSLTFTADPVKPPWPALATDAWSGLAREVEQWLRGELRFELNGAGLRLQRQAALLWERRFDLQQFFELNDREAVERYHLWTLTDGMRERSIDPDLFSPDYLDWLNAPSSISRLYDDVPLTNGMALTRHSEHARDHLQTWRQFPLDPKARLEQAFWYAFLAPEAFGWPAAMTASVKAYFDLPSDVRIGDYALSHGMVALHAMREDVRSAFLLADETGAWRYLCWFLMQGAREMGLDPASFCPGIREFLDAPSREHPLLSHMALVAYSERKDLQAAFNLQTRADVAGMQAWVHGELGAWLEELGLAGLLGAKPNRALEASLPPYHCHAALAGDWTVSSGIGEDLRTCVASLDACGFTDYVIVDLPSSTILTAEKLELRPGTPVRATWQVMFHNADTAVEDWHAVRRLDVVADRYAAHWLWELERLPAQWVHAFSFCDEIWAASDFVTSIFEAEDRRPVKLLHHSVTAPRPSEDIPRHRLGLAEEATVFLFMFDFASYAARKNPQAVILAFLQAFPLGDENVQLVIKTQNAALRPRLWAELIQLADDARVIIMDARLTRNELIGLVATANAFVSLHRSEGFGRGPAEAMLLGVPVIVTGYSGTADFTDESCACIVPYTLVPVQPGEYPGVEGQRWAEADIAEAACYMRWVYEEPEQAKAMGRRGQLRATDMLNAAKIGADMLELFDFPSGRECRNQP